MIFLGTGYASLHTRHEMEFGGGEETWWMCTLAAAVVVVVVESVGSSLQ